MSALNFQALDGSKPIRCYNTIAAGSLYLIPRSYK